MHIRARATLLALASALAACAGAGPSKPLPPTIGGGMGSEFGNYAATAAGTVTIDGQRCYVWNWDRPFAPGKVLRYRSASCPSTEFPGRFIAIDLDHSIVPLAESDLRFETAP